MHICWITDKFGISQYPDAARLQDEIKQLKEQNVEVLVSLLTHEEEDEVYLCSLEEDNECDKNNIEFVLLSTPDGEAFTTSNKFAQWFCESYKNKKTVIHCKAGIGRSGTFACAMLIHQGFSVDDAIELVSEKRIARVPETDAQIKFLKEFHAYLNS